MYAFLSELKSEAKKREKYGKVSNALGHGKFRDFVVQFWFMDSKNTSSKLNVRRSKGNCFLNWGAKLFSQVIRAGFPT